MAFEVTVPRLPGDPASSRLGAWLRHEGEVVRTGDAICRLLTAEDDLVLTAPGAGSLRILPGAPGAGEALRAGAVLGFIVATESISGQQRLANLTNNEDELPPVVTERPDAGPPRSPAPTTSATAPPPKSLVSETIFEESEVAAALPAPSRPSRRVLFGSVLVGRTSNQTPPLLPDAPLRNLHGTPLGSGAAKPDSLQHEPTPSERNLVARATPQASPTTDIPASTGSLAELPTAGPSRAATETIDSVPSATAVAPVLTEVSDDEPSLPATADSLSYAADSNSLGLTIRSTWRMSSSQQRPPGEVVGGALAQWLNQHGDRLAPVLLVDLNPEQSANNLLAPPRQRWLVTEIEQLAAPTVVLVPIDEFPRIWNAPVDAQMKQPRDPRRIAIVDLTTCPGVATPGLRWPRAAWTVVLTASPDDLAVQVSLTVTDPLELFAASQALSALTRTLAKLMR